MHRGCLVPSVLEGAAHSNPFSVQITSRGFFPDDHGQELLDGFYNIQLFSVVFYLRWWNRGS